MATHPLAALFAAAMAVAVVGGCGSTVVENDPMIDGSPKKQVAATVNAMFDAWNAGDGEAACSYLTDRGRKILPRIAVRFPHVDADIADGGCERAVAESAAAAREPFGLRASAKDVSIDGRKAQAYSEFGTAVLLRKIDSTWLVNIPMFIN